VAYGQLTFVPDLTADNCHFRPGSPDVCSWNLFNFRLAIQVNWLSPPLGPLFRSMCGRQTKAVC